MRLIFGMILGAALTIGGAYVADTASKPAAGVEARPMVNWDVVGQQLRFAHHHDQAGLGQAHRLIQPRSR